MTPSMPPEPPRRDDRKYDELIAVLVTFLSFGGIFFWSLRQPDQGFDLSSLTAPPASTPQVPQGTPSPALVPTPNSTLAPSPQPSSAEVPALAPDPSTTVPRSSVVPYAVPIPAGTGPAPAVSPSPTKSSVAPVPPVATATRFSDVPASYWAAPFIAVLSEKGVIEGFSDNTFQPDKPVTRAEFAALLQKAFDKPQNREKVAYKDLPATYWAVPAITEATRTGFMNGYPDQTFRPDQAIPRAQAIIAIATGLGLRPQATASEVLKVTYDDAVEVPRYAVKQVAAATESGLVVNYPQPKQLNPGRVTTRAEAAAIIYQALAKEGRVKPISSQYIIQP